MLRLFRKVCPREILGYACHRFSQNHGYKCEACGRSLKVKANA